MFSDLDTIVVEEIGFHLPFSLKFRASGRSNLAAACIKISASVAGAAAFTDGAPYDVAVLS